MIWQLAADWVREERPDMKIADDEYALPSIRSKQMSKFRIARSRSPDLSVRALEIRAQLRVLQFIA